MAFGVPLDCLGTSLELLGVSLESRASIYRSFEPLGDHFGGLGGVLGCNFGHFGSFFDDVLLIV